MSEAINYVPGEWYEAKTREELEAFFASRIPAIREAAREQGYAIGLHGSMRRDLDLIAVPWRERASDKDVLAHAIAVAACGITRDGDHQWEMKPLGRLATSLPCCWPSWYGEAGAGHIDLSVMAPQPAPSPQPAVPVVSAEQIDAATRHMYHNGRPTSKEYRVGIVSTILALRSAGTLTGCNCRWDGETQIEWCELHLAHKDAIHDWAERAKSAEQKLAMRPAVEPMTLEQREVLAALVVGACEHKTRTLLALRAIEATEGQYGIGITAKAEGGA